MKSQAATQAATLGILATITAIDAGTYAMFAAAGGTAGLIRFLRSTKTWKLRVVFGYALFGAIASVAVIGWWFGNEIHANPWKCVALSLAIGFGQPEFADKFVVNILKAVGMKLELEQK